jgi:hypothetical protein
LEIADKRLEEQRKEMDREPLGQTTEQGLGAKGSDRTGTENKKPSLIEKKLSDKKPPTENSKLQGLVERRLDTASTDPYPHRNPEAWERTGDKRQINNLEPEQKDASDEKRAERFEKSDKEAQGKKERILDKDVGKQLTNKKAFNLSVVENAKKYSQYIPYLNHKAGSGPYSNRVAKLKDVDSKLESIMSQKRELTASEQKQVVALKKEKSVLLRLAMPEQTMPEPPEQPSSIGKRPQVGQVTMVHNMKCKIIEVYRAGTIDVECPDGKNYRVTGLGFI